MRVLALDTTVKTATVALTIDGVPEAHYSIKTDTHSTTLLPMIESVLKMRGLNYADIDLYGVSCGPGSFTGIRIGVATVKGLAFSSETPCIGVSSLEAMARNFAGMEGIVVPAIDARRGLVYSAIFRSDSAGNVTRLCDDEQLLITDLIEKLTVYNGIPIYFTGDANEKLSLASEQLSSVAKTPMILSAPVAYGVSSVALDCWKNNPDPKAWQDSSLMPIYLRKAQAEMEREERLKNNEQ